MPDEPTVSNEQATTPASEVSPTAETPEDPKAAAPADDGDGPSKDGKPEDKPADAPAKGAGDGKSEEEPAKPTGEDGKSAEPSDDEKTRKGKGLERRFRELTSTINKQKQEDQPAGQAPTGDQPAQPGQPAAPAQPAAKPRLYQEPVQVTTPQDAQQVINDLNAYVTQHGELPDEIDAEEVQQLQALATGRMQAQSDAQVAELQQTVSKLSQDIEARNQKEAIDSRVNEVESTLKDFVGKVPALQEGSEEYDEQYEEAITQAFEEALQHDAERITAANLAGRAVEPMDVQKWLSSYHRVYEVAQARGGETVSAGVAKQAATQALTPSGASRQSGVKPAHEMTDAELDDYLAKADDRKK